MRALPPLTDVSSDLQIRNPQVNVLIDRDSASAVGITANQIEDALVLRVWFAAGFNDSCAEQPISRDPGAEAGISARCQRDLACCMSAPRQPGNSFR